MILSESKIDKIRFRSIGPESCANDQVLVDFCPTLLYGDLRKQAKVNVSHNAPVHTLPFRRRGRMSRSCRGFPALLGPVHVEGFFRNECITSP